MYSILRKINKLENFFKKKFPWNEFRRIRYSIYRGLFKKSVPPIDSEKKWSRFTINSIRAITLFFCILRFHNVSLDFPASITTGGAPLTDEGWYFGGAINKLTWGEWYIAGDFNAITSLPLSNFIGFPILAFFSHPLLALRLFTGLLAIVSIYFLRNTMKQFQPKIVAEIFSLFVALDFLLFSYSRIALLEIWVLSFCSISSYYFLHANKKNYIYTLSVGSLTFFIALAIKPQSLPLAVALFYAVLKNPKQQNNFSVSAMAILIPVIAYFCLSQVLKNYFPMDYELFYSINIKGRMVQNAIEVIENFPGLLLKLYVIVTPMGLFGILGLLLGTFIPSNKNTKFISRFFLFWFFFQFCLYSLFNYHPERYFILLIPPIYFGFINFILILWRLKGRLRIPGLVISIILIILQVRLSGSKIMKYHKNANSSYVHFMNSVENILKNRHADIKEVRVIGAFAHTVSLYAKFKAINTDLTIIPIDEKIAKYQPEYLICFENDKWDIDKFNKRYQIELLLTETVMKNYYKGLPLSLYKLNPIQ